MCGNGSRRLFLGTSKSFQKPAPSLSCLLEIGSPFTQKALQLKLRCEKYKLQSEVVTWERPSCLDWEQEGDRTQD